MNPPVEGNKSLALAASSSTMDSQLLRSNLTPSGAAPLLAAEAGAQLGGAGTPSMGALLHALRRRWLLASSLASVATALSVFLVLLVLPVRYTVQAAVQVHSKEERPLLALYSESEPEFAIIKANQAALIKSPLVLLAALDHVKDKDLKSVHDQPNPVKWLEANLKTDFLVGPEVLRITLSGDDAQEVAALANAVVDAYLLENKQKEDERRRTKLELLEANRQKTENIMRNKRNTLRKIEEARGLDDLDTVRENYRSAHANLGLVRKDLLQAQVDLVTGQEELKGLEEREKKLPTMAVSQFQIDRELEKMAQAKPYLDRISLIVVEIEEYKRNAVDGGGEQVKGLQAQLENLRIQARQLHRPEVERKVRGDALDLNRLDMAKVQEKINAARKKQEVLADEVKKAEEEVRRQNPNGRRWPADVEALRDEVTRLEVALTKLGETIAVLLVEPPQAARVSLWQRAEVPSAKDMSRQVKFGGAAGLGIFCMVLFGVGYVELRAGRISAPDEIQRGLGMNVVGMLPPAPARAKRAGNATSKNDALWESQLAESVDSVRTMLLHSARSEDLHVVMVTSAVGGEGKTSLASQLAASLARSWRKTLLIDGDLRNPAVYRLFNLPPEPGFSEVLRGEVSPAETIKPTALSRLWVMPAGQWDSHAVQALAQDSVRTIFDILKQQYDFIIVDSSPILPVADALSLGQHVDGVLFSVLRDVSRIPALQAAQQRLSALRVRTLGAVIIGAQAEGSRGGQRYVLARG